MKKFTIYICCVLCLIMITTYCGIMQHNTVKAESSINLTETAKASLLLDYNTNEVLFEKDSTARFPIASMVKMMTILLTCEAIDNGELALTDKIQTSENASSMGGSQVFIDPYVEYDVGELLKSVILSSANDSSVALAERISGSEQSFVEKMNERANELGMKNTLYANCTGLPAPEQYSSAYDCSIVLREVIKHEVYHLYSTIWMQDFIHPSGRKTEMVNTNKLTRYYEGCDSGKTGSTNEAGYCLSASAKRNDMRLIAVVIGAKTSQERFKEVSTLFNYGFANFENKLILSSNEELLTFDFSKAKHTQTKIFAEKDCFALCKKGDKGEYEFSTSINKISAPVKSGEVIGVVTITKQGKVIEEINLIVKEDVEKSTYFDDLSKVISAW